MLFLVLTAIPIFDPLFKLVPFVDALVILSVAGCYFGAGYVGSRISAKYYNGEGKFAKRYIKFSLLSFAVLVAVALSPLSFLMIAWSFIAPYCVLLTLNGIMPKKAKAKAPAHGGSRVRTRRRTA